MPLLSARLLVPVAVVMIAWGGAHLLTSHSLSVTPAVWPLPAPMPSSPPGHDAIAPPTSSAASPSPSSGGEAIPILPGALRQLNGSTRDTAVGLYALIQQLEEALRAHLQQLLNQLEPRP
jgi:hypothetical protein